MHLQSEQLYSAIEPILFILILSFSIAYIIQYRRTSLVSLFNWRKLERVVLKKILSCRRVVIFYGPWWVLLLAFKLSHILVSTTSKLSSTRWSFQYSYFSHILSVALMLYHVEKSRVQRDSDHETDQTTLVGHEMKNVTSSSWTRKRDIC